MISKLRRRIKMVETTVSQRLGEKIDRPRVVCIEWIDPFFVAGHWVPRMVEIAGGKDGIGSPGEPSRRIGLEEISQFQPDKIILMPCGFDIERTFKEMGTLNNRDEWRALDAVKSKEVYVVNANAYFSKPGPRIVVGLEILAKIIDPEAFANLDLPLNSYMKFTQ